MKTRPGIERLATNETNDSGCTKKNQSALKVLRTHETHHAGYFEIIEITRQPARQIL
jgi:hypothetical protein